MLYDGCNGFIISEIASYNHLTGRVVYITPNTLTMDCRMKDVKSNWEDKRYDINKALHLRPCVELINYPPRVKSNAFVNAKNRRKCLNYVKLVRDVWKHYDFNAALANRNKWI